MTPEEIKLEIAALKRELAAIQSQIATIENLYQEIFGNFEKKCDLLK